MKKLFLVFTFYSTLAFAENYSDCILENMQGVGSQSAAYAIREACYKKALPHPPAKCLPLADPSGVYTSPTHPYFECKKECLDASFWSKHFGDCKP